MNNLNEAGLAIEGVIRKKSYLALCDFLSSFKNNDFDASSCVAEVSREEDSSVASFEMTSETFGDLKIHMSFVDWGSICQFYSPLWFPEQLSLSISFQDFLGEKILKLKECLNADFVEITLLDLEEFDGLFQNHWFGVYSGFIANIDEHGNLKNKSDHGEFFVINHRSFHDVGFRKEKQSVANQIKHLSKHYEVFLKKNYNL